MENYQLYLENIINALARVGIHYPIKLESYEDLFFTSESLGSFLEINSFLQRVGEGYSLAGLDESTTFRSYWYSEFYLEFQERVNMAISYRGSVEEEPELVEELEMVEEVSHESLLEGIQRSDYESESVQSTSPSDESKSYNSLEGVDEYGLDYYGVAEEEEDEENLSESDDISEEEVISSPVTSEPLVRNNYNELVGVDEYGLDSYGVEEENFDEDDEAEDAEEVITEVASEPSNSTYSEQDGVDEFGLDYYGMEDENYDEDESSEEYDEENDPDNPLNGNYEDEVTSNGFDDYGGSDEDEDYDEENDPNNPLNGTYEDLVTYEDYDEENDPDNPLNGNYEDLVSSSQVGVLEEDEYDEENDPDNPFNGNYVDTVTESNTSYEEEYAEENDPDNPLNGHYEDVVADYREQESSVPQKPREVKVVPKKKIDKDFEETTKLLKFMGNLEKSLIGKVRNNGKK